MKECIKCPNCNYIMEKILYYEYIDGLDDFIRKNNILYGGMFPILDENFSKMVYHCLKCNISYSEDLKKQIRGNAFNYNVEFAKNEIIRLVEEISNDVYKDLDNDEIEYLKKNPKYDHFGFGSHIRNKFVYNNDKIKYKIDADTLAHKIYDKLIEKIKEK